MCTHLYKCAEKAHAPLLTCARIYTECAEKAHTPPLTVCTRLYRVYRKGTRASMDRKQSSGCLWLGGSWELLQMGTTDPFEMMEIL